MKKEELENYIKVPGDKTCSIPLIQATELLKLKRGTLPIIKIYAEDLMRMIKFLENERATDLEEYQNHIFLIKERLIPQDYLKVKNKLKRQFKSSSAKKKNPEVALFINNCIFLELDHMGKKLNWVPMILGEGEAIVKGATVH